MGRLWELNPPRAPPLVQLEACLFCGTFGLWWWPPSWSEEPTWCRGVRHEADLAPDKKKRLIPMFLCEESSIPASRWSYMLSSLLTDCVCWQVKDYEEEEPLLVCTGCVCVSQRFRHWSNWRKKVNDDHMTAMLLLLIYFCDVVAVSFCKQS